MCECLLVRQELLRLFNACEHQKATDIMVDYIMILNPGAERQTMLNGCEFGQRGQQADALGPQASWDLSYSYQLPELFNTLVCTWILYLNNNNLQSLPESFANITVGGSLTMSGNPKLEEICFPNVERSVHLTNGMLRKCKC